MDVKTRKFIRSRRKTLRNVLAEFEIIIKAESRTSGIQA